MKHTKPEQPITEVARRAIEDRLKAVWHYAPLASDDAQKDVEYVHQLRVATRRARAAIHIFADLLPNRQTKWMKKRLRRLRKAAGDARDLDVLGFRLRKIAKKKADSRLDRIVKQIAARRRKAQKPLVTTYKKTKSDGFKKRSRALARSVRWRSAAEEPTFSDAARSKLAPLVDEFFAAAKADLSDIDELHEMRIVGKQVRYAMELLAGAFEDPFRGELYETFKEVQDKVGTVNDHATAIVTFKEWFERADKGGGRDELAELIAEEEKQLDEKHQAFHQWWTADRIANLRQRFANVLRLPTASKADLASMQESKPTEIEEASRATSDHLGQT